MDQGSWEDIKAQGWTLPPDVAAGIQAQLVDKLEKSGYFIVLEQQTTAQDQMSQQDALAAQRAASQPTGATPMPVRQTRTAANYIITPSVIGFTLTGGSKGGFNFGGLNMGNGKTTATLTLNIRISDAETSEILDTETAMGTCASKSKGMSMDLGGAGFSNDQFEASPAGQAVDLALSDAVTKIVGRLSQEPWQASVAAQDKTTKRIIINAGQLAGVQVGQEFDVFRTGGAVTDPDTGEIISKGDEVKIGRIKVVSVERSAAFADIVSGAGFLPRDVVRVSN